MATDVATRIAERTRIADLHMQGQGWFGRITNRIGLFIANSVDTITGFVDNDRTVFLGATAAGLFRGAVYGLLVTVFIAAMVSLHAVAVPLLLTLMTVGALGYGIYDGEKGLERHLNKGNPKLADTIAEKFGTVPDKTVHVTKNPEETLRINGRDPALEQQVQATIEADAAQSFARREEARRGKMLPPQR